VNTPCGNASIYSLESSLTINVIFHFHSFCSSSAARLDSESALLNHSLLKKSNGISYPGPKATTTTTLLKPAQNGTANHLQTNGISKLSNGTGPTTKGGLRLVPKQQQLSNGHGPASNGLVTFQDAKFLNGTGFRRKSTQSSPPPLPATSTDPGISLFTTNTVLGVSSPLFYSHAYGCWLVLRDSFWLYFSFLRFTQNRSVHMRFLLRPDVIPIR